MPRDEPYATLYLLGTKRNTQNVTHLIILLYVVRSIINKQIFLTQRHWLYVVLLR